MARLLLLSVVVLSLVVFSTCYDPDKYKGLKRDTRAFQEHGIDMSFVKQYPDEWPLLGPFGVYDQSVETSSQYRFKLIPKPHSLFWFQFCKFDHSPESFVKGPFALAVLSFFTWWFCYRASKIVLPFIFRSFFKGMSDYKTDLVCVKTISIVHSVVATVLGWLCVNDEELLENYLCGHNMLVEYTLCTVIGYMLFDGMKVYQTSGFTGWPTMTIHHVNIIPVFFIGLYYRVGLRWVVAYVINEASSPFLQFSWFMLKFGNPKGKPFMLNLLVTFVTFIGLRGVYNAYTVWRQIGAMQVYPYIPLIYVLFFHGTVHLLVNWYWCSLFIKQVINLAMGKNPLSDKQLAGAKKKE